MFIGDVDRVCSECKTNSLNESHDSQIFRQQVVQP
jgi:hypothetical protein